MAASDQGTIQGASEGGVAGSHPIRDKLRMLAGPATEQQFNTFQSAIVPIACFKVENIRFDFDSSVVLPDVKKEMPLLAKLIAEHTDPKPKPGEPPDPKQKVPPASVFGHADPIGNDEYNKALSGRRAAAIYGMLARRAEVWEDLFKSSGQFAQPAAGDNWGTRAIQIMLGALPADLLAPPDGSANDPRERVRRFQAGPKGQVAGLAPDGDPGPQTRKALFLAYMDQICVDAAGQPFQLDAKEGFLGHQADPDGKGDFQGCSEFNPALLLSKADKQKFDAQKDKTQRNEANEQNRRVMVLLFRPGAKVTAKFWPCPRAKEGTPGCRKRFWSDGEKRRSNGESQREFKNTNDTFACRFYQRLLTGSPCETIVALVRIRLFDRKARPLPFAPCLVTQQGKEPRPDRASGSTPNPAPGSTPEGDPTQDAFITIRDLKVPTIVNVKWSRPAAEDGPGSPLPKATDPFEFEMDVVVDIPEADPEQASLTRLKNLGYVQGPKQVDDIRAFQRDYKPRFADIEIDGTLNPATQNAIKTVHDGCDPVLKG